MTCGFIKIFSYIFFKFFILLVIYRGFWAVLVRARGYFPGQSPASERHVCESHGDDKSKQIIEPEKPKIKTDERKIKIDESKFRIDESTILPQELHADPPQEHDRAPVLMFPISTPKTPVRIHQDYQTILKKCLKKKILFKDPEFPADLMKSVFLNEKQKETLEKTLIEAQGDAIWEWRRPQLKDKPVFYFNNMPHRFSIKQGYLGDCWFISAVSGLAMYPELIFRVAPIQNFENYAGIFHFHFWQNGEWVDVVVDDQLLHVNGNLAFAKSEEYAYPLLEKAYAKLHGSYMNLDGSIGTESYVDLTGGIAHMYNLSPKLAHSFFKNLLRSHQMEALLSCGTITNPLIKEDVLREGIVTGHEYTITNVAEVLVEPIDEYGNVNSYVESLIRVRNPWGQTEWNGRWADHADEWNWVSQQIKEELQIDKNDDGEFWMSANEFMRYFNDLTIVDLTPDSLLTNRMRPWSHYAIHGEWLRGLSAGGKDRPDLNPHILFTITDPDKVFDDGKCLVSISLLQKHRRIHFGYSSHTFILMGFRLYHWPAKYKNLSPIPRKFFKIHKPIYNGTHVCFREITQRFRLPPSTYLVVPNLLEADLTAKFLLRVFTSGNLEMTENDQELIIVNPQGKLDDMTHDMQLERYQEMFLQLEELEIGWKRLKPIMDYFGSTVPHFKGFNKETVRSAIFAVNADGFGKIDNEEFTALFAALFRLKALFVRHDPNGTGHISAAGMQQVFNYLAAKPIMYHVKLNQSFLKMICHRFGKDDGSFSFDDFVLCLMKITASSMQYRKSENFDAETASVDFQEWLKVELFT